LNEPRYAALPNIMKARKNRLILSLLLIMALQLVLNLKQLKLKHLLNVKLAYK
jgi:electron transfer flavoprotein alpha/beta subunit